MDWVLTQMRAKWPELDSHMFLADLLHGWRITVFQIVTIAITNVMIASKNQGFDFVFCKIVFRQFFLFDYFQELQIVVCCVCHHLY